MRRRSRPPADGRDGSPSRPPTVHFGCRIAFNRAASRWVGWRGISADFDSRQRWQKEIGNRIPSDFLPFTHEPRILEFLRFHIRLAFRVRPFQRKHGSRTETGGDGKKNKDRDPASVSAKESGEVALKKFSVAQGLRVDLWAEEPLLANVVALSFDEKGRAFVVETYRRRTSVPDIRKHMEWLLDSLAMRTVEDRIAFLHKTLAPELKLKPSKNHADQNGDGHFDWHDWEIESERIKLLEDRNGTGKAEVSSVFADGFSSLETGVAAGVVARGDDVWFACIPDIWHFSGRRPGRAGGPRETALRIRSPHCLWRA